MLYPFPAALCLALLSLATYVQASRSQGSSILSGIQALHLDSEPATSLDRRQVSTQLCANNYCTSLDAPGLGALQKCKTEDQPCICQASQQLASSCLSCHGNFSSITEIFEFYEECRLIPKPPTAATCRPLCSADLTAVKALSACGPEDSACICKGVETIESLGCLNCIMYLGGQEYTGTDVKQTCIISSSTLATALRPSSTITPTSTSTSSAPGTLSYPSEAITSTISIARPTAEGTTPSSEPPAPSETAQSENGSLKAADAWNAGGLIVLVAVTFYFL